MCTQKPPHDYSQQLYDKYRESFEEYITSTVSNYSVASMFAVIILLKLFRLCLDLVICALW